jgi:thiamine biosynthesis lipoprotein
MNSDVTLVCGQPDAGRRLDRATRWLAAYEDSFSRFRPLSELSRLNAAAGRPFHASVRLYQLVRLALDFAQRSGGLFDATVLRDLDAAGYDRSFELVGRGTKPPSRRQPTARRASWRDLQLDNEARTITLPAGSGIDLGGLGKGWAIDRLAGILGLPCLVNGGGDVYVAGQPPDAAAWRVGVADPFHPDSDLLVLQLQDRGVATSSSLRRQWRDGDMVLHHLIDPRTGRPSQSDAVQVTVVAESALLADYHAKVVLLLGAADGAAYLARERDVEGVIVRKDGRVFRSQGLSLYASE